MGKSPGVRSTNRPSREQGPSSRPTLTRGASGGLLVVTIEDNTVTNFGNVPPKDPPERPRRSGSRR